MNDRQDALAAAAIMIIHLETFAKPLSPQAVATVGRISANPTRSMIPGFGVDFTIDRFRPDAAPYSPARSAPSTRIAEIAANRNGTRMRRHRNPAHRLIKR